MFFVRSLRSDRRRFVMICADLRGDAATEVCPRAIGRRRFGQIVGDVLGLAPAARCLTTEERYLRLQQGITKGC